MSKKKITNEHFDKELKKEPDTQKKNFLNAVREMLCTELAFIEDMKILRNAVIKLDTEDLTSAEKDEISDYVAKLDILIKAHESLTDISSIIEHDANPQHIVEAIIKRFEGPKFNEVYNSFPSLLNTKAINQIYQNKLEDRPSVREQKQFNDSLGLVRQLELRTFTLTPVQRVCKLPLLFKGISQQSQKGAEEERRWMKLYNQSLEKVDQINTWQRAQEKIVIASNSAIDRFKKISGTSNTALIRRQVFLDVAAINKLSNPEHDKLYGTGYISDYIKTPIIKRIQ
jgi:hypothetical protein